MKHFPETRKIYSISISFMEIFPIYSQKVILSILGKEVHYGIIIVYWYAVFTLKTISRENEDK